LKMSPFGVFFLLILVSSLPGDAQTFWLWLMNEHYPNSFVVTKTLVFHIYYSCAGTLVGSSTHNNSTYSVCCHDSKYICFNPIYGPQEQWLEVQSYTSTRDLISCTQVYNPQKPVSIYFDMWVIIAKNPIYWP
jgi:hypothetical protein